MSKMLDPILQAKAVTSLRETLAAMGEAEDAALLLDMIEGETGFFEACDRILSQIAEDHAMVDAIKKQRQDLQTRGDRFSKRAETAKALLEQAFLVADLPKVERPGGTLFLSKRQPKVIIDTESDIPARFWKEADPVLDGVALREELKTRSALFEAIIAADPDDRQDAIAAFIAAFPQTEAINKLSERLDYYWGLPDGEGGDEPSQAKAAALSLLRSIYALVPGATLTPAGRSLSLRVA
jgi:hypothetical protein